MNNWTIYIYSMYLIVFITLWFLSLNSFIQLEEKASFINITNNNQYKQIMIDTENELKFLEDQGMFDEENYKK